jgi:hypothetical protein
MENINNPVSVRYAIVEAVLTSSEPEHFIIGYRTEQSLHEFLVGSCIVASGYSSREEAAQNYDAAQSYDPEALPAAA